MMTSSCFTGRSYVALAGTAMTLMDGRARSRPRWSIEPSRASAPIFLSLGAGANLSSSFVRSARPSTVIVRCPCVLRSLEETRGLIFQRAHASRDTRLQLPLGRSRKTVSSEPERRKASSMAAPKERLTRQSQPLDGRCLNSPTSCTKGSPIGPRSYQQSCTAHCSSSRRAYRHALLTARPMAGAPARPPPPAPAPRCSAASSSAIAV
mmetsp:Transcript_55636/g.144650  ORF Transcript_55636/g.144650 Transcript_55636/m.144650 type:complete len:208 (-) Transcript_55636:340-963(-)